MKSKQYKEQQIKDLSLCNTKEEGSKHIKLSVARIVELFDKGVLQKPINQRDMTSSEVSKNAKLYFGNLMFRAKFAQTSDLSIKEIPELEFGDAVSLGDITLTARNVDGETVIEYQDGQHRIHYLNDIVNNKVPLACNLKYFNKGVNRLINSVFDQANSYGIDTSKGIYFCMLPTKIQNLILNFTYDVNFFSIVLEDERRTLYDLQNSGVAMSNHNRHKNIYAGTPIYDEIQNICKVVDKNKKCDCLDELSYLAPRHRKLLNQLTNGKLKGKNANVTSTALIPLLYRCVLATETSTDSFLSEQRAWTSSGAHVLANNFLNDYADLTTAEAQELIKKTLNAMYHASQMLDDHNNSNSIFAGRLALLPAAIFEYRILTEKAKSNKSIKAQIFAQYKDPVVKANFVTLCDKFNTIVSSTYYKPSYVYSVYNNVLLGCSSIIKDKMER